MTVAFHAVFFLLILAGEQHMCPKIELDSWKEWVRNSALQMTTFCRDLELGETESNSSRHDLQNKGRTDV